jgi:formate dehydrogenase subunit gamma
MPSYEHWDLAEATSIVAAHAQEKGATLPILHDLMERFGYVDKAIVPVLADAMNLSRAEIHGTITFYHDFKDHAPGRCTIKVCRAEACQSRGALAMHDALKQKLGIDWHGTTSDGAITIEPVYCLGLCACAPAVLVDGEPVGHVHVDTLDALIDEARA